MNVYQNVAAHPLYFLFNLELQKRANLTGLSLMTQEYVDHHWIYATIHHNPVHGLRMSSWKLLGPIYPPGFNSSSTPPISPTSQIWIQPKNESMSDTTQNDKKKEDAESQWALATVIYNPNHGIHMSPWFPTTLTYPGNFNPLVPPPPSPVARNSTDKKKPNINNGSTQENRKMMNPTYPRNINSSMPHPTPSAARIPNHPKINGSSEPTKENREMLDNHTNPCTRMDPINPRNISPTMPQQTSPVVGIPILTKINGSSESTQENRQMHDLHIKPSIPIDPIYPRNTNLSMPQPTSPVAGNLIQQKNDGCNGSVKDDKKLFCPNCKRIKDPPYRRVHDIRMCNACGLALNRGRIRRPHLFGNEILKRYRKKK